MCGNPVVHISMLVCFLALVLISNFFNQVSAAVHALRQVLGFPGKR